jgi:hypothetical protein
MKFSRKGSLGHPDVWFSFKMPRKVHLEHQVTLVHMLNFQDMALSNVENKEQGS